MEMDRTTPIGLYNFGVSFFDTARLACQGNGRPCFNDPIEFLCAHGLELVFKADICRTLSVDEARKQYGHDLIKLSNALSQDFRSKFTFDADLENVVNYLAIGHSGPEWRNRYIVTGSRRKLLLDQILPPLSRFNIDNRRWLSGHFVKVTR